jgi:small ligand-binding sensory domain FIST
MAPRIGCGLSEGPEPRIAAVEAGTAARAALGDRHADLVLVFCSGTHLLDPEATLEGVREALDPPVLAGCGAGGVLAGGTEVERGTAVSVWAAAFDEGGSAEAFHLPPEGAVLPDLADASALLLLPDPSSFPVEPALEALAEAAPGVPVLGGVASAHAPGGGAALLLGDEVHAEGAVAVVLRGVEVLPCVSQGAAPLGPELEVTAVEGHVVHELSGRPALDALRDAIEGLSPFERAKLAGGLLLGVHPGEAVGPDAGPPAAADVLVRGLLGADPDRGSVAVGAQLAPGTVVQLHARDAESADRDLRDALALRREAFGGVTPAGALMFTCNGRGTGLFGRTGHDAGALRDELGAVPVAGFFAAGEIGPVGGSAFLHGFTATVAVFAP